MEQGLEKGEKARERETNYSHNMHLGKQIV